MRQAVPIKPKTSTVIMTLFSKTVGFILFAATVIVALAMAASFYSYHPEDPAWSSAKDTDIVHNIMGERGAYFADIMLSAIGNTVWLFPILLLGFGYQLFFRRKVLTISLDVISFRLLGVLIAIFSLSALLDLHSGNGGMMGGFIGTELIIILSNAFSIDPAGLFYATKILFAILALIGFYLITGMGPIGWADYCGAVIFKIYRLIFPKHESEPFNKNTHLPSHDGNIQQDTIDRMLTEDNKSRKAPSFLSKMFASKSTSEEHTRIPAEFIEIDESLLTEDEYETNAPLQDTTFNSYNYNPLEAENTPQETPENDEDTMKNNNNIPPIFRNLQKAEDDNSVATSSSLVQQEDDNLKLDALTPEVDESWDNFIRTPKAVETEDEPTDVLNPQDEKKSIPSIFRNLFKARRKKREDITENADKVEPLLADSANSSTNETAPTSLVNPLNQYASATNTVPNITENLTDNRQNDTQLNTSSDLQFSISDAFEEPEAAIETFEYLPEDPIATSTGNNTTETYETETPPTSFQPESIENSSSNTDIDEIEVDITEDITDTQSISTVAETAHTDKPKFIGHEFDPRSGMPIPVKAPKEYPMAGRLPGLDLLGNPPPVTKSYNEEELAALASLIEEQFKHFNIAVTVVNIEPGPVITRFELDLAPGVKIAQINNLNKDIARALSVSSVRVVEIIPGKPYIGLEIPNKKRQTVYFKEGLYADAYRNSKHPLTILLGADVSGNQVAANLKDMPHLLIAGTTGSGKSVGINTIILSLLYKAHPEDLRLIMIDPKMLELSVYEGIPHLLAPVVTDMKESANALRWAVMEMERRYLLMSKLRVRNIGGFNQIVKAALQKGEPVKDPLWDASREVSDHVTAPDLTPLPYIVIIIDELADMMMTVGKAVEELIARLTQKARAAGIHMVVATQRPSVDVITGLIKANIPSRIAFQVSSKIDSRTVLDQQGAENLLGLGDMLFFPTGASFPQRVHGSFVSDDEVNRVTDFLRLTGPTNYIEDMLKDPQEEIPGLSEAASGFTPNPNDVEDVLYDEAVKIVLEDKRPTISYVQRKLRIGYQRAARLIETMEEQGIVSAPASNGNREILVTYDK